MGNQLFARIGNEIVYLSDPADLFAFLQRHEQTSWKGGPDYPTKAELFAALRQQAKSFVAIEGAPHEPPIKDRFYACDFPQPGDGSTLRQLLGEYSPATTIDTELIASLFATPLCDVPDGRRPAYLIDSDDGRGSGKTTLATHVAALYGGGFNVAYGEDIDRLKARFLTPAALTKRIAIIDNVKTLDFSNQAIESLITDSEISGRRNNHGEATRPNNLTWIFTLNSASLSTDVAQRAIIIKLSRPSYDADWEERVQNLIQDNRERIFGDLIAMLRREPKPIKHKLRWSAWVHAVLAKCDDPAACVERIIERQSAADVEVEGCALVEDYFAGRLQSLGFDPERCDVFIPNPIAAAWYNAATGERAKTVGIGRRLHQWEKEGKLTCFSPARSPYGGTRGYRWTGVHCDVSEATDWNGVAQRQAKNTTDKTE